MKKIYVIVVAILITFNSAFAVWWNPFTWRIFNSQPKTELTIIEKVKEESVVDSSGYTNLITCNGNKYSQCKDGQSFVCPVDGGEGYCKQTNEEKIIIPKVKSEEEIAMRTAEVPNKKAEPTKKNEEIRNIVPRTKPVTELYIGEFVNEYASKVKISTEGVLKFLEYFDTNLDEILDELDSRESAMKKVYELQTQKKFIEGLSKSYYEMDSLTTQLAKNDLEIIQEYRVKVSVIKDYIDSERVSMNAVLYSSKKYSAEEALKQINANNEVLNGLKKIESQLNLKSASYNKTFEEATKSLNSGINAMINYLQGEIPISQTPTVRDIKIPQIKMPSYSTCYYSDVLKRIDCTTY